MFVQRHASHRKAVLLVTALVSLALMAAPAVPQCATSITNSGTGTTAVTGTAMYFFVTKTIGGTYQCTLTMTNNAYDCEVGPTIGAMGNVSYLQASALTMDTNPSCGWNCGCGSVTIGTADGLPVELLDFGIDP